MNKGNREPQPVWQIQISPTSRTCFFSPFPCFVEEKTRYSYDNKLKTTRDNNEWVFYRYHNTCTISPRTEAVSRKYSVKKVFLKILQNSKENTCIRLSFLIKLWHRCFPVTFEKFLRISFLKNTSHGSFCLAIRLWLEFYLLLIIAISVPFITHFE